MYRRKRKYTFQTEIRGSGVRDQTAIPSVACAAISGIVISSCVPWPGMERIVSVAVFLGRLRFCCHPPPLGVPSPEKPSSPRPWSHLSLVPDMILLSFSRAGSMLETALQILRGARLQSNRLLVPRRSTGP